MAGAALTAMRRALRAALAFAPALLPAAAQAQAASCRVPPSFELPSRPVPDGPVRRTPVAGYTLALSWSPAFCREQGGARRESLQCSGAMGRFGFVLHGLWPEGRGTDWPQWCPARTMPDRATLRRHLCMTPSPDLLAHEWAKHGACMSASPARYFAEAERAWAGVRLPDMAALAAGPALTAGALRRAFVAANPGLPMRGIRLLLGRGGQLKEVHLCLDRAKAHVACPAGRDGPDDDAALAIAAP
ncbi:ribonuclease T2 family protein [Novosphingobium huizhouense]|uniref:ribonuclease T2 family protein n=1 Tax=Novosphingobium huizhouense TaxID=2866625 RepID=UPI001CD8FB44|nr:ribonuclease T [Novosphingobium huizhouense]